MDKLFYSKDNFNLISQIIGIKVKEQYNIDINNSQNKLILNSMNYVFNNINPNPPSNISPNKYLDLMNIKCLSIVMPRIEQSLKQSSTESKQINTKQLDQRQINLKQTTHNEEVKYQPDSLPIPSINHYTDNITEQFENLQENRNNDYQSTITSQQNETITEHKEEPPSMEETKARFNARLQERNIIMRYPINPETIGGKSLMIYKNKCNNYNKNKYKIN